MNNYINNFLGNKVKYNNDMRTNQPQLKTVDTIKATQQELYFESILNSKASQANESRNLLSNENFIKWHIGLPLTTAIAGTLNVVLTSVTDSKHGMKACNQFKNQHLNSFVSAAVLALPVYVIAHYYMKAKTRVDKQLEEMPISYKITNRVYRDAGYYYAFGALVEFAKDVRDLPKNIAKLFQKK